jgi:hypothetical protein
MLLLWEEVIDDTAGLTSLTYIATDFFSFEDTSNKYAVSPFMLCDKVFLC